jgi:hypothetical protein
LLTRAFPHVLSVHSSSDARDPFRVNEVSPPLASGAKPPFPASGAMRPFPRVRPLPPQAAHFPPSAARDQSRVSNANAAIHEPRSGEALPARAAPPAAGGPLSAEQSERSVPASGAKPPFPASEAMPAIHEPRSGEATPAKRPLTCAAPPAASGLDYLKLPQVSIAAP